MNTLRAARVVRRLILPLAILLGVLLFWFYGTLRVPAGMDTMPALYPPGTVCVIRKSPGSVVEGAVVFVDVPGGGTLLSRVARVDADGLWVEHDNPKSRFPDGDELGRLPIGAVRGLVLTALVPDGTEVERGR